MLDKHVSHHNEFDSLLGLEEAKEMTDICEKIKK